MEERQTARWFDPRQWSFTVRLALIITVLVTITLIGMTFITIRGVRAALTGQVGESFQAEAESLSDMTGLFLLEKVSQLQVLALTDVIKDSMAERNAAYTGTEAEIQAGIQALDAAWATTPDEDPLVAAILADDPAINPVAFQMHDLQEHFDDHTELIVTDRFGATVAATSRPPDYYQADDAWWQAAWNDGAGAVYISEAEFEARAGVYTVVIGIPIHSEETGEIVGILHSRLILDQLVDLISSTRFGRTGQAMLLDRSGEALVGPGVEEGSARLAADLRRALVSEEEGFKIATNEAGATALFGHSIIHLEGELDSLENQVGPAVANLGWATIFRQDADEAFASVNQIARTALLVELVVVALAGLAAFVLARTITRPLVALGAAAAQLGAGNLDIPLPPAGRDEIGRLAQTFNTMTRQLRASFSALETDARRLETVAHVSERLTAILNLDDLLAGVVNEVQENFGYYHAHIYLLDDERQNLVVAEGTGQAGVELKARGHSIPLNAPTSLVARAARTGQVVRVDNVREAADWLPNPLLPDTYAEMAVPIDLEGEVVGVLDVQQDRIAGLDEGDASLLQTLANQVAVALRNAHLFAEVEANLAQARQLQARYMEQTWSRAKIAQRSKGQAIYSQDDCDPPGESAIARARQQARGQEGRVVPADDDQAGEPGSTVSVAPITLNETAIGSLQLHGVEAGRTWTDGETALIEAVLDQVAQAAENLRLFEQSQERASRERLISRVSDKLRRAPDHETLMRVAVEELSRALRPARTFVRFGGAEQLATPGENGQTEEELK